MNSASVFIGLFGAAVVVIGGGLGAFLMYRQTLREAKNYERGLKMVPILIHLPPASDDIEVNSRDKRDVVEEALSQASVMYNIIASTATKGLKSKRKKMISCRNLGVFFFFPLGCCFCC